MQIINLDEEKVVNGECINCAVLLTKAERYSLISVINACSADELQELSWAGDSGVRATKDFGYLLEKK